MDAYETFLASKAPRAMSVGIEPSPMPDCLLDFAAYVTAFCIRQGRAALFLDTGLTKTRCQLEFSKQAAAATNGIALILTPLAVTRQFEREGLSCGYDVRVVRDAGEVLPGINICNYDRLDKLDCSVFGSVSLDESAILKSFTGATTRALIAAFANTPFRLCATATPAPNDHMELGQHAEFLGIMPSNEMLARWFISDQTEMGRYRLKRFGEGDFWDWLCSWARMATLPSDVTGNQEDDKRFHLPKMNVIRHQSIGTIRPVAGSLFLNDISATNMHIVKRETVSARVSLMASIILGDGSCTIEERMQKLEKESDTPVILPSEKKSQGRMQIAGANSTPKVRNIRQKEQPKQNYDTSGHHNGNAIGIIGEDTALTRQDLNNFSSPREGFVPSAGQPISAAQKTFMSITATPPMLSEGFSAERVTGDSDNSETIHQASGAPQTTLSAQQKMPRWIVWCDTDYEQDEIERSLGMLAISVRGSQPTRLKESLLSDWFDGLAPVLVCKPVMFGFGLNLQTCHQMIFVGRSFSYESWYQAVRRCWRFGQTSPVDVHIIVAEGEEQIGRVIDRKAGDHAAMKVAMAAAMKRDLAKSSQLSKPYNPTHNGRKPEWLISSAA